MIEALRLAIGEAEARSTDFATARREFLAHAKQAINKESMITLLARVVRVSMDTVAITDAMRAALRE